MSDFFAELEEDIREERLFQWWRQYGNWVIGGAIAIVLATAGYVVWNHVRTKQQLEKSTAFTHAFQLIAEGHPEKAIKAFQALAKEGGGYGTVAQLYEASLMQDPTDLYRKIIKDNPRDTSLANLGKVLLTERNLTATEELEPLTAPNNAWAPLARELLALAALKKGETAVALKHFIAIVEEPSATPSERLRARMMVVALGEKAAP